MGGLATSLQQQQQQQQQEQRQHSLMMPCSTMPVLSKSSALDHDPVCIMTESIMIMMQTENCLMNNISHATRIVLSHASRHVSQTNPDMVLHFWTQAAATSQQ